MATGNAGRGRPRQAQKWKSTMRYNLFLSFAADPDVHTALHLAGAAAPDLLVTALREYIGRHAHPAGQPEVQARAALAGLGMTGQAAPAGAGQAPAAAAEPAPRLQIPAASTPPALEPGDRNASPSAEFAHAQLDDA